MRYQPYQAKMQIIIMVMVNISAWSSNVRYLDNRHGVAGKKGWETLW